MASGETETFSIFGTPHDQAREYVTDINSLEPGDHITFGNYLPNTFLGTHAIVEKVDYERGKIHIIYFRQSMFYGNVVQDCLKFGDYTISKLQYKPRSFLPAEDVVEYARSKVGCSYNILTGGYFVQSCKTGEGRDKPPKPQVERGEEKLKEGNVSGGVAANDVLVEDGPEKSIASQGIEEGGDQVEFEGALLSAAGKKSKIELETDQVSSVASFAGRATMSVTRVTSKAAKKAGSLGVIGAVLELASAAYDTSKIQQLKKDQVMSQRQSEDALGTRWTVAAGSTAGPLLGAAKGAVIGGALAGPAAPVGAIIGSVVGGISGLVVGTGIGVGLSKAGVAVRDVIEEDLNAKDRDTEESLQKPKETNYLSTSDDTTEKKELFGQDNRNEEDSFDNDNDHEKQESFVLETTSLHDECNDNTQKLEKESETHNESTLQKNDLPLHTETNVPAESKTEQTLENSLHSDEKEDGKEEMGKETKAEKTSDEEDGVTQSSLAFRPDQSCNEEDEKEKMNSESWDDSIPNKSEPQLSIENTRNENIASKVLENSIHAVKKDDTHVEEKKSEPQHDLGTDEGDLITCTGENMLNQAAIACQTISGKDVDGVDTDENEKLEEGILYSQSLNCKDDTENDNFQTEENEEECDVRPQDGVDTTYDVQQDGMANGTGDNKDKSEESTVGKMTYSQDESME